MQQSCQTYNNSWCIDAESFSHVALTSHRPAARAPARRAPPGAPRSPARPENPTEPPNDPRDAGGEPGARGTAIPDCAPGWPRTRVEAPSPPTTEREQNPGRRRGPADRPSELRFAHRQAVVVYPRRRARWRPIGDRGFENQTFRVFSTARNEALNRFRRPPSERRSICLIAAFHALWAQTRTEDRTKRTEGAARLRAAQHRNYLADGHCTSIELLNGDPGFPFASSSASSRRPTLPSAVCLRSRWR